MLGGGAKGGEKERFGDSFQLLTRHVCALRILGAGALIAAEAGAKVTNSEGQPRRQPADDLFVASPEPHSRFIDILEPFREA